MTDLVHHTVAIIRQKVNVKNKGLNSLFLIMNIKENTGTNKMATVDVFNVIQKAAMTVHTNNFSILIV